MVEFWGGEERSRAELSLHLLCTLSVTSIKNADSFSFSFWVMLYVTWQGETVRRAVCLTSQWCCSETKVCSQCLLPSAYSRRILEEGESWTLPPAAIKHMLLLSGVSLQSSPVSEAREKQRHMISSQCAPSSIARIVKDLGNLLAPQR